MSSHSGDAIKTAISSGNASWTHSQLATAKLEHTWTVDKFSYYLNSSDTEFMPIYSTKFSPLSNNDLKFNLQMWPNGDQRENNAFVSLYLWLYSPPSCQVLIDFEFSILDKDDQCRNTMKGTYMFTSTNGIGWPKFIERSKLLCPKRGLLKNDQLKIRCQVSAWNNRFDTSGTCIRPQDPLGHMNQLTADMKQLFYSAKHSDVTLIVRGVQFAVHKSILAARSPVFSAMFDHGGMKEASEGTVTITDVDSDTFQALLQYIYGQVPDKKKLTEKLLSVADKYQVDSLKGACEDRLSMKLSIESAAKLLLFADMHSAANLKVKCLQFIAGNAAQVKSTEAWKQMVTVRPHLCEELFLYVTTSAKH